MYKHFNKIYGQYIGNQNTNKKEVQISCPFHEDKKPSMSINTEMGLYNCFSCGEKGSAVGFYMRTRNVDYKTALKELGDWDENYKNVYKAINVKPPKKHVDTDYTDYCVKCTDVFYGDDWQKYGKKLYELRGITFNTAIHCLLGYEEKDNFQNKIRQGWIFPIIRYPDKKCVGYEVREKEFKLFNNGKKCEKAINTPSCLAVIYEPFEIKNVWITEGFVDAYFAFQWLFENNNGVVNTLILSPSNGVHSLPKLMKNIKLPVPNNKVMFILDNDPYKLDENGIMRSAGNDIKAELAGINPEWQFFGGLEVEEDFEDFYKRSKNV